MNPGTFYLYEYDGHKRTRNVGFIKVARHYRSCIFQIHARGIPAGNGASMELYAFFRSGDDMLAEQIAVLNCFGRNISARLPVPESNFPEGRPLAQIDGFLIKLPGSRPSLFWMASAFFFDADVSRLKIASRIHQPEPEAKAAETQPDPEPTAAETAQTQPEAETSEAVEPEAEAQPETAETAETQPDEAEKDNVQPETEDAERTEASSPKNEQPTARKIRRTDLSQLPRKFWPLANNSFLLHGYHNYGHLLLIEEDGRMWLGVPGTYAPQEARAADLFGFPRFTRSYVTGAELTAEECSDSEDFGHWCRCIGTAQPRSV